MPKDTAERPLIGRQAEKLIMQETLQNDKSELIAIYGRRRVGKTYLIRQVFQNKLCFELSGSVDAPMEIQLANFAKQLDSRMNTGIKLSVPANWPEAFDMLKVYLTQLNKEGKKVVFFDELPWLDTMHSGFLSALDYFWNSWCTKRSDIVMVICGSAASWMIEKVIQNKGGLHNRITRKIRLLPFTLKETREFLQYKQIALDEYQIAQLYMVAGGVAHYLDAVQRGKSATQNIDLLCFDENGILRHEFEQLYHSLFRNAHRHIAIIRALSKKNIGLTRSEIAQAVQMQSGGNLSQILKELQESGFIMASRQPHRKLKDMVYRLTDEYSCFYLRFIEPNPGAGAGAWALLSQKPAWKAWSAYAFETLCLKHIQQIKEVLQMGSIYSEQYAWYDKNEGAQIDLIMERADQCINLCEIKFTKSPYEITAADSKAMQHKAMAFRSKMGSNQTIFNTWITSFGLKKNKWYPTCVDAEVQLQQLF